MTSTFSKPAPASFLASQAAAWATSPLCWGWVLTLGMRSQVHTSSRWRWRLDAR
ncbi:MAG: hypothetical protein KJZ86_21415 [Caldilineaceae bacterium]|nr:hypothetical protein [Caldilineaceae bacterium]HRJ45544.1 hypothetical protein [Caldilineaceae bacterium]